MIKRNLVKINKSLLVTLPKHYCSMQGFEKGDRVKMEITENGSLIIQNETEKNERKDREDTPEANTID